MDQPVFFMFEATPYPNERDALKAYLSQTPAIAKEYGATPVATYDVVTALVGDKKPGVFMVLSFPTRAAIDGLFNDPAYQALIPLRDRGFSDVCFYVVNERI
jgi:uncharacterized protein (DUF1330 family)